MKDEFQRKLKIPQSLKIPEFSIVAKFWEHISYFSNHFYLMFYLDYFEGKGKMYLIDVKMIKLGIQLFHRI